MSIFNEEHLGSKCLYHYTSLDAIDSIESSNVLWASNYRNLNDPTEHTYGWEIVKSILEKRIETEDNEILKTIWEIKFKHHRNQVVQTFDREYYTVSFSEEPDSLDLWRFYGNDGNGCSIGIKFCDWPQQIDISQTINPRLMKVIYDKQEQEIIINNLLNEFAVAEIGTALWLAFFLDYICLKFKSIDYQNEKEWRVVYSPIASAFEPGQGIDYRTSNGELVRYYQFPFLDITGIHLGPKRKVSEAIILREKLLRKRGKNIEVKCSEKKYR